MFFHTVLLISIMIHLFSFKSAMVCVCVYSVSVLICLIAMVP